MLDFAEPPDSTCKREGHGLFLKLVMRGLKTLNRADIAMDLRA